MKKNTLLKFTKTLALKLLHKNSENLNVHDLDPDQLPLKVKNEEKHLKECDKHFLINIMIFARMVINNISFHTCKLQRWQTWKRLFLFRRRTEVVHNR